VILPARERLLVEREKIVDYLLNPDHRYGASKARFFGAFGFRIHWHCPVCNDNGFISVGRTRSGTGLR
jgi:hypothetical protein